MNSDHAALIEFKREANRPEAELDLGRAVLALAKLEYADLNSQMYLDRLDELAEAARPAIQNSNSPAVTLAEFLFGGQGFTGNAADYNDPRNSFLNEVLERRLGIPISLSVLFLEVARRLNLPADGIGLPRHFIVRAGRQDNYVYLDPFHGGHVLSEADCQPGILNTTPVEMPLDSALLEPVSKRYILTRMLTNLKIIYLATQNRENAMRVSERLLVVQPDNFAEMRNLGLLCATLGHKRRAAEMFGQYLAAVPNADDAETVTRFFAEMSSQVARWN